MQNGTITATTSVVLTVGNQFFVSGGGGNTKLYKKTNGSCGNTISQGQSSYTITSSGEYSYFIQDGYNPATYSDFEVVIPTTNAATPTITTHPQSGNYTIGAVATPLSVVANVNDGGILAYQWYSSNTNSGGTAINGATSQNYSPPTSSVGIVYTRRII
jgi:hypothetical protein